MSSWQPIETAPKDGTDVLLFVPPSGILVSSFNTSQHFENNKLVSEYAGWVPSYYKEIHPTHWMPLPAPPEATG